MNNPNTPMPVSELIKKLAIDASDTLRPKENRTVIELPDIESIMGLLGNAFTPNNVDIQPEVNDMPSYNTMLAEQNTRTPVENVLYEEAIKKLDPQYVDPYADAPGPTEPTDEAHRQMLIDMEYNNSPEGYNERLKQYKDRDPKIVKALYLPNEEKINITAKILSLLAIKPAYSSKK